jgi:hypothetical protein
VPPPIPADVACGNGCSPADVACGSGCSPADPTPSSGGWQLSSQDGAALSCQERAGSRRRSGTASARRRYQAGGCPAGLSHAPAVRHVLVTRNHRKQGETDAPALAALAGYGPRVLAAAPDQAAVARGARRGPRPGRRRPATGCQPVRDRPPSGRRPSAPLHRGGARRETARQFPRRRRHRSGATVSRYVLLV